MFHRKQCIELEQQFDFLKDLVAAVPDMQGEGEENHAEGGGEKVPRRYFSLTYIQLVRLCHTMTGDEWPARQGRCQEVHICEVLFHTHTQLLLSHLR